MWSSRGLAAREAKNWQKISRPPFTDGHPKITISTEFVMTETARERVAIIGTGLAGLTTAHLLQNDPKKRYAVTLLEQVGHSRNQTNSDPVCDELVFCSHLTQPPLRLIRSRSTLLLLPSRAMRRARSNASISQCVHPRADTTPT